MRRFWRDQEGNITLEAAIILPVVIWMSLLLFSFFDAFRSYATAQKASYTIADMMSRETNPLDGAYLAGARGALGYLAGTIESDTALRVTSVTYDSEAGVYLRDWSQALGWVNAVSDLDVAGWEGRLPELPDGDRVVVVETWIKYETPFKTGLGQRNIQNFIFTRPRYAPQVLFNDEEDGSV